ncbi:pRL2-8 [Streptomyces sp. NPDC018019]|uniref:pRL2-8 n=1 Tax=Streptomyces sp. NPDC018019 TaxID=3365030 RepID=UPI0037892A1E
MCKIIPPGECPQCYHHGNCLHNPWSSDCEPSKGDCQQCIACKAAGHPNLVPKTESTWW